MPSVIAVGSYPFGEAYDPQDARLFVADFGDSNISVVNTVTNKLVATIPLTYGLEDPAYDASNGLVYIGDCCSSVYAINATTDHAIASIALGTGCTPGCAPVRAVYDSDNDDVYTVDGFTNNLSVINEQRVIGTVGAGISPDGLGFDEWNGDLYVSNDVINAVSVVDGATNQVVGSIPSVQSGPAVVANPANGDVFVAGTNGTDHANVSEISATSDAVVNIASTGNAAGGAAYDPITGNIYVTQRHNISGDVSGVAVLNGTSDGLISLLPSQEGPIGIAYDDFNHEMYVADSDTNNLSLLFPLRSISFDESGLPDGANWSVSLNNMSLASNTSVVPFTGADGPFQYLIHHVPGYTVTPRIGNFTVSGSNVTVDVTFAPVTFAASFNESGLPANSNWSVVLGEATLSGINASHSFDVKNGTYNFTVNPPVEFRVVPSNGSLTINGTDRTVSLVFTALPTVSTLTYLGLTVSEWAITLAIAVIIIAVAIFVRKRRKRRHAQTVPPLATKNPLKSS